MKIYKDLSKKLWQPLKAQMALFVIIYYQTEIWKHSFKAP